MERDPVPADFVGKTITRIETGACNVWRFFFSDGSAIAIEAEVFQGISVMQVCEECVRDPDRAIAASEKPTMRIVPQLHPEDRV